MKRKSTKDHILHNLKKCEEMSMKELMTYFKISEAAVRKQLNELLRLGFVRERTVKKDIGRPFHLYCLTTKGHQTFPNQYETLPAELLQDLEAAHGEDVVYGLLRARRDREAQEMQDVIATGDFRERVQKMVVHQEKKGYMIDMEETIDGGFEIHNYNCPIFNLASNYNIVCAHEKEIYHDLFPESKVITKDCMTAGGSSCCWAITKPDNEK